jgi:glycosyltransferase involved in cell wall biosynthesis
MTSSFRPRAGCIRREYDIIFDFSASPVGGGLKRLLAYVDHFAASGERVLFLVHPQTEEHIAGKTVKYEVVRRNPLARLWFDPRFVSRYGGRARWFFSYGIPIYGKVGDHNWLHVSNALPFGLLGLTLDIRAFTGNFLLRERFVACADNCSVVSGESEFTLDIYRKTTGWRRQFVLLPNGMEAFESDTGNTRQPQAITVGTSRYKRLDRTCAVLERMQMTRRLDKLLIVGNLESIPLSVRREPYVACLGPLPHQQVLQHMRQSQLFISTSEIENSSNAVLEALALCGTVVVSDIPSHRELIGNGVGQPLIVDGLRYLQVDAGASALDLSQHSWNKTISHMLSTMASLSSSTGSTKAVRASEPVRHG